MPNWLVGEMARMSMLVKDMAGAAADPTTATLKVKTPAGVTTNYTYPGTVTRLGVGSFQCDVALTEKGKWLYRWETDAPYQGACQGEIPVSPSNI